MIAEASKGSRAPTRRPGNLSGQDPQVGAPASVDGDWDLMSPIAKQKYVRSLVEDHLASLDAEVEREDLRRENDELKAKVKEWEKGGKTGRRPTRASLGDGKPEESAPAIVNKVYKFLFGDPQSSKP